MCSKKEVQKRHVVVLHVFMWQSMRSSFVFMPCFFYRLIKQDKMCWLVSFTSAGMHSFEFWTELG